MTKIVVNSHDQISYYVIITRGRKPGHHFIRRKNNTFKIDCFLEFLNSTSGCTLLDNIYMTSFLQVSTVKYT